MKKKLICTAIILTMITSLTACGSNSASDAASDDDSMAVSTEIATDDEAEKATTEADSVLSANNKGDASDSTNKPATNNSTSSTNNSKPNNTTESTAPATEAPREDSHTTTEAPAATEQPVTTQPATTAPPATTEAPVAPATENRECPRSSTGNHKWREVYDTITVVDQEAWDENTPTGEYYHTLEEHLYSYALENKWDGKILYTVDITGMSREQLRQYERDNNLKSNCLDACWSDYIEVPDYNNPIYTTVHHDAVTHTERVLDYTECTVCGAHK